MRGPGARTPSTSSYILPPAVLVGGSQVQPPVDGIVSLSSPADPDILDVPAAVADLTAPVLFVAAEDDAEFGSDARTLYRGVASDDKA